MNPEAECFHHFCRQMPELELPDDAEKVVINAAGKREGLNPEIAAFLDYLQTAKPKDKFTTELDSVVRKATENKEWRQQYMTLYMKYQEEREAGRQEGRAEGRAEGMQQGMQQEKKNIARKLLKNGLGPDLISEATGLSPDQIKSLEVSVN